MFKSYHYLICTFKKIIRKKIRILLFAKAFAIDTNVETSTLRRVETKN